MKNVLEFVGWAASHASPARIPKGSKLCVALERVGEDGVWQYLYGTTGVRCTQSLLNRKFLSYYKPHGWTSAEYKIVTDGWVENGVTVCDCQGLEDYYSGADTNAKGNYANYCEEKGLIKEISRPFVYGEALFCGSKPSTISHVGWVAGFAPDGEILVLHERGIAHGCVIERLSKSGKDWTYRGLMTKRYEYTPQTISEYPRYVYYRGATYTTVRYEPTTNSEALGKFRAGEQAIIIGKNGTWDELVLHNQSPIIRGWCKDTYTREE